MADSIPFLKMTKNTIFAYSQKTSECYLELAMWSQKSAKNYKALRALADIYSILSRNWSMFFLMQSDRGLSKKQWKT